MTAEYLTVTEAAEQLDVNYKTLYSHLKRDPRMNGIAIAVKISGVWKCLPEAIERVQRGEYVDEQQTA